MLLLSVLSFPFSVSCKVRSSDHELHSFCLSGDGFITPSFLDSFAGYSIISWQTFFFNFSTLNISSYSFLACEISAEKSTDSLVGVLLM